MATTAKVEPKVAPVAPKLAAPVPVVVAPQLPAPQPVVVNTPAPVAVPAPAAIVNSFPQTGNLAQDARAALAQVGTDPVAEEFWMSAINNPTLSNNDRKNLIEDLNEDGLSNPQNPTAADLPVIMNRIALIDKISTDALDQTNAAAFQEARKDLVNMYNQLAQ